MCPIAMVLLGFRSVHKLHSGLPAPIGKEITKRKTYYIMAIIFPIERSWLCPEGNFAAKLINHYIDYDNENITTNTRLVFQLVTPGISNVIYLAAKNYRNPHLPNAEFVKDIKRWLGSEFVAQARGKEFNVEDHYGRPVELVLTHEYGGGHRTPFVKVGALHTQGSLKLTQAPPIYVEGNI